MVLTNRSLSYIPYITFGRVIC